MWYVDGVRILCVCEWAVRVVAVVVVVGGLWGLFRFFQYCFFLSSDRLYKSFIHLP